jgi:hypothetical protein
VIAPLGYLWTWARDSIPDFTDERMLVIMPSAFCLF